MFLRRTTISLAISVGLALTSVPSATAAETGAAETLEGVIRLLVTDPVERTAEREEQVLVVGDASYVLTALQGEPNTRVRVTGIRAGSSFAATDIQELGPTGDAVPPTGTTRILVMLGHWSAPDGVTSQQAANAFFGDGDGWYDDASYGALGQVGDVTPWMQIAGPAGGKCYGDSSSTMAQAKSAAVALGYDLSDYDNYALYSPNNSWQEGSDCNGYAGWAYVGSHDLWLNGYIDRRVVVHEEGHNYGLLHSHSYLCDQVVFGSCQFTEYGDDFDAMGASGLVGHFSASQKDRLGWMGGRSVDLTAGGSATLAPIAADPVAVSVAVVHATAQRSYWLEYRQAIDYDSGLPAQATNGVLVHMEDTSVGGGAPNLLDTRPGDGLSTYSATMRPGESWTTPEGYTIAVSSATPTGADVTVSSGLDVTAPTLLATTPGDGAVGVKRSIVPTARFSEPVTGVTNTTFRITNAKTGVVVASAVSQRGPKKWAVDPTAKLDGKTRYQVTVIGGPTEIRDLAGNPLETATWRFKTGR